MRKFVITIIIIVLVTVIPLMRHVSVMSSSHCHYCNHMLLDLTHFFCGLNALLSSVAA